MVVQETINQNPEGGFEYVAVAITGVSSGFVWTFNTPIDPNLILPALRQHAQDTFSVNPDWIPPVLLQTPIVWQSAIQIPGV